MRNGATAQSQPAFRRSTFLPFAAPSIGEAEIDAVVETLRGGWLTSGPRVREFEEAFASAVGVRHAVAVNSCTAALHLALDAVGVGPGDEVITTPMTFAASANVIVHLGAKPVFADIDPLTMNIDPPQIEWALGRCHRARAIVPVHFAGLACEMDAITGIAQRRELSVIEDAAHCFPTTYKDRLIGSIGDVTCFSFYATKTITTGEGGMATTDDPALADRMCTQRLHGMSRNAWMRYAESGTWRYDITAPGYKCNMPELAAALGLVQLSRAGELARRRRATAGRYTQAFRDTAECLETPPNAQTNDEHSWHLYVIKLRLQALTIDRDRFIEELRAANIGTSVHFIPLHLQPYYRDTFGLTPEDFPQSTEVSERIISLPIYPGMSDGDIGDVIEAVTDVCRRHRR
ncbi:MAG TPA: DegT/DnrJ/EryC1/StrS family aminotransferase [candidate division Zixibacteria bacterium]|jgi:dTDP-4-amino-4,6-dideoxygalactose transaminase